MSIFSGILASFSASEELIILLWSILISGIEEDLVVLAQRVVGVMLDLGADGDNAARERGNLDLVREVDADLGDLLVPTDANQGEGSRRFLLVPKAVLTQKGSESLEVGSLWTTEEAED